MTDFVNFANWLKHQQSIAPQEMMSQISRAMSCLDASTWRFPPGRCVAVSLNRGRHISIEIMNSEGAEELIQNAPLMAMIYDRPGKGNDLVIETGKNEVTYAHTVDSPTEVLTGQSESGRMLAVWIKDATGTQTFVKLQPVKPS